ncbi:MAG: VWA domain-containing protein [Gemmatimonadota bacterium]|jgi:Ca-activated chloride channel family protein
MSFAHPALLPLALLLPLAVAVLVAAWANRRTAVARALADRPLLGRLGVDSLLTFPLRRFVLLVAAALLLGLAAAGPRWGTQTVEGRSNARSIVLAADVSKSMLAEDVRPNRLERQRLFIRRLLRGLAGDRVGLVAFAGQAYVLAPLTVDMGALNVYVDALDPGIVSQGGSSLASALKQAVDLARGPDEIPGDRTVILISDGEALEDPQGVIAAADRAARAGVRVITVGIGTPGGARVPELDGGRFVGYKRDENGDTVISRLDAGLLENIASSSGGRYFPLSDARSVERVLASLGGMSRAETTAGTRVEPRERYAVFALLALLVLVADVLAERRARRATTAGFRVRLAPAARLLLLAGLTLSLSAAGIGDVERGNRLFRKGRYAEAVEAYQSALAAGSNSPELRYNLGTAYLRLGRYDEAEENFRAALDAVDPSLRQRTYYNLGSRFLEAARSGNSEEAGALLGAAVDAYQRALRLEPGDEQAKWNLELAFREAENRSRSGPEGDNAGQSEQSEPDPSQRGGSGGSDAEGSAEPQRSPGPPSRSELTREQAERILDAVERGERDLTREKLRKGQRRTPVGRDW